jgi:CO dehydrogenase nickel-insertion accessory protein CooC1
VSQLPTGLVVLSREGCGLCDEMLHALAEMERTQAIPKVTVVDVDSDPGLARRYGLKVPVLLLDGTAICHYTLNSKELLRLLGSSPAIIPR